MSTSTPGVEGEFRLGFLIHDVSRLRRSAFDRGLKPLGVTRAQWWVLANLARKDGMTQSQLAEALDLGKVAVGGLLDRLERSGLVRREIDPNDRRVNRVFLEPSSQRVIQDLRQVGRALNQQILEGLSHEEIEVAAAVLDKMKHNLLRFLAAEV